jgi:hypothetical protein
MAQQSLFHEQDERERLEKERRERLKREKAPPVEFILTLFDGTPVKVVFALYYFNHASHFEFRGDMTNTGYRSHFTGEPLEGWTEAEIRELALKIADDSRMEFAEHLRRETRKAAGKKRVTARSCANQP